MKSSCMDDSQVFDLAVIATISHDCIDGQAYCKTAPNSSEREAGDKSLQDRFAMHNLKGATDDH